MLQGGVYEAKTRLSQLIDRAAKGEEIIITKHGIPVAALVPVAGPPLMVGPNLFLLYHR